MLLTTESGRFVFFVERGTRCVHDWENCMLITRIIGSLYQVGHQPMDSYENLLVNYTLSTVALTEEKEFQFECSNICPVFF